MSRSHLRLLRGAACGVALLIGIGLQLAPGNVALAAAPTGIAEGVVLDQQSNAPLARAFVQACLGDSACRFVQTDELGRYRLASLEAGVWGFRVSGPGGTTYMPQTFAELLDGTGTRTMSPTSLFGPAPIPAGTTITNRFIAAGGLPVVSWGDQLTFTTTGCVGGEFTFYHIETFPSEVRLTGGTLVETSPGTYTATFGPLRPSVEASRRYGYEWFDFFIGCANSVQSGGSFNIFIDPSSTVRTPVGAAIAGATVELQRADSPDGIFVSVPQGNGLMSSANRSNPQTTDAAGRFGWDLIAGYYRIRASAPGCVDPNNAARAFIETPVFAVPPQIVDLDLRLSCSTDTGGTLRGSVTGSGDNDFLAGAYVQACLGGACALTQTNPNGDYVINGLAAGEYAVRFSPPSSSFIFQTVTIQVLLQGTVTRDVGLGLPLPFPEGTTITNRFIAAQRLAVVNWGEPLTLTTSGCSGGIATYQMTQDFGQRVIRSGPMPESSLGTYTAIIQPLLPASGYARIDIAILCGGGTTSTIRVDIYIDPSGTVRSSETGREIAGAMVTLFRADTSAGPLVAVPAGSAIMSAFDRRNPQISDAAGHFGWDVITGFYRVRAEATGCVDPADSTRAFVETATFAIPPQATDLDLRLSCAAPDTLAPVTTATATPAANANGWNRTEVTVSLAATDDSSGVASLTYGVSGLQVIGPTTVTGASARVLITAEGVTTISYSARDNAGNVEATRTRTVRIDRTPPTVTGTRTPAANPNGWNNGPVTVRFDAHDALSGFTPGSTPSHDAVAEQTLRTDGDAQSASHSFTDLAENTASATVTDIRIDTQAPATSAAQTPEPNANGWNRSAVSIVLSASDNLSRIARTEFSLDAGAFTPYVDAIAINTQGFHMLRYRSTDRADNAEVTRELVVKIDLTSPEATIRFDPTAFDIAVSARDDLSKPSSVTAIAPSSVVSGQDRRITRTYRIEDRAGNSLEVVILLKRDRRERAGDDEDGDRAGHESHAFKASVGSLRYNDGALLTVPKNELEFEWTLTGTSVKKLEQDIQIGSERAKQEVEAKFDARKNETKIEVDTRGGERKLTRPGLVLLRVETDRGALTIRFE